MSLPAVMLIIQRPLSIMTAAGTLGFLILIASTTSLRAEPSSPAIVALEFRPPALTLTGPGDTRQFLVMGRAADGTWHDLTRSTHWQISGSAVSWLPHGALTARHNGTATLRAQWSATAGQTPLAATLTVTVEAADRPAPISFATDVMPILGKTGCNSGACHGGQKGRNGFKLSLRGYDPDGDHQAIVQEIAGRRIDRHTPANSLVILKPTMGVPHEGRLLFTEDSRYYTVLRDWIAQGATNDVSTAPRVVGLSVEPAAIVLGGVNRTQQVIVTARYNNGRTRDVTPDAVYSSSAESVATVSAAGLLTSLRKGEAAILIRYEGQFAVVPVSVMIPNANFRWSDPPQYNMIDQLVDAKLRRIGILPSEVCDDAEFLRRVSLDLTGQPPTLERTGAFLSDTTDSLAKRTALVDELLASPEFVDFWTLKWADLLQVNRKYLGERGTWAFRNWIAAQVAADRPWNEVATELLTASGGTLDNPPSALFRIARDPEQAVETTTHLFLGIRFNCNKCHDHPFERWTQSDYYNLAAYFGRTGLRKSSLRADDEFVLDGSDGEVKHLRTGAVAAPTFPYSHAGYDPKAVEGLPRRQQLAAWLAAPENPYFARSMANRLWGHMTGRGLIEPVDDIRAGNPPSNPELLEALTAEFVTGHFSIRRLLRTIALSRTYQLSIIPNATNVDDTDNFSRARPRRLTSEQLLDALRIATGTRNAFAGLPADFRAAQLPDPAAGGASLAGFLEQFGRPVRESPCDCERRNEMSLGQALTLVNGPTIAAAISAPEGRIHRLFASNAKPTDTEIVETLYMAVLCRPPSRDETTRAAAALAKYSPTDKPAGAEDLMWALLNSPAFLFNR